MIPSLGKPLPLVRFADGKSYDNYITEGWSHERSGRMHQSLDLRAPVGTTTYAVAPGRVVFAGFYKDGSGGAVELDHGDYATRYLHLSKIGVQTGQTVSRGAALGLTGHAVSPHLHFDLWGIPSAVSAYIARFGRPAGLGQTKSFAGKTMTKLPAEPFVPATYQPDVIAGAAKGNVPLYRGSKANVIFALLLLAGAGYAAYRYFKTGPSGPHLPA